MKRKIDVIALIILILSAVSLGLIGLFDINMITWLFGTQKSIIVRAIYITVAIAGLWCINLIAVQRRINMVEREKQDHVKGNAIPNSINKSDQGSLKDNPDGETICSSYFSDGCINEDTDSSSTSQKEVKSAEY